MRLAARSASALLTVLMVHLQLGSAAAQEAEEPAPAATATSTQAEAAGGSEVARLYAEAGANYYRAGKYLEAIQEFKKAEALTPTPALTYNMARCHERLSQWSEAIALYERYVTEVSDPREKSETLDKIQLLQKKLGEGTVDPDAKYKARIEGGRRAFAAGDYEGAIEEFKAAFDLKPTGGALYNIAKSYEKMGRYEESIDYFQQYLDLEPTASDRADIEESIRRLQKSIRERFQELSVASDPPGADIYLDDRTTGLQGQTNFRFKTTPGPHTLFLDLNGYEPVKRDFVMPDDKPLALDFKLKKLENVGFVEISVSVDGARIFVDGAIVGLSPYKQKKTLEMGPHQIQVEQLGYDRWTREIVVEKDKTTVVDVVLKEYDAPVEDATLSSWGRNLMLIGIVGGGLGFAGPFAYQKLVTRRAHFDQLGPENGDGSPFYRGSLESTDPDYRQNGELKTLRTIQLVSLIAGGVFTAGGLTFYMYKWFRTKPPGPVTSGLAPDMDAPWVTVESVGVVPTEDGAAFGLVGSF